MRTLGTLAPLVVGVLGGWLLVGSFAANSPLGSASDPDHSAPPTEEEAPAAPDPRSAVDAGPLPGLTTDVEPPAAGLTPRTPVTIDWQELEDRSGLWGLEARFVPPDPPHPPGGFWTSWGRGVPMQPPFRVALPPGEHVLVVARDRIIHDRIPVTVGDAPLTVPVATPPLDPSRLARIEVRTNGGAPVGEPRFLVRSRVERDGTEVVDSQIPWVLPLSPGRFLLCVGRRRLVEVGGVELGWTVEVRTPDLGAREFPLILGRDGWHEVHLPEPIPVTIALEGYVGHPMQGAGYVTWGEGAAPTSWSTARPDPLGRVHARVRPGETTFAAGLAGGLGTSTRVVELAPPEAHISFSLPPLYPLVIDVPPAIATTGARFELHVEEGAVRTAGVERDGCLRFPDIPPGRHSLIGPDGGGMTIVLPSGGAVRYDPGRPTGFIVGSMTPEWVAAYGLSTGAVLVAVDGVPVGEFADTRAIVRTLPNARAVTVRDGGTTTELRLPDVDRSPYPNIPLRPVYEVPR